MSDITSPFQPAHIQWQDELTPYSPDFDDYYFNTDGGIAESRYVFIEGNQLEQRWQTPQQTFTIGETGFGTGLNFLLTRELWLATQTNPHAQLTYITCEKYPLTPDDLAKTLAHWPSLAAGAKQLLAQWPPVCEGQYTLSFDGGRIQLILLFGDATERLATLNGTVDCWYLDGFSPARNDSMWRPELFAQLAAHSHNETHIATFTSAGFVRRGLQACGFKMGKRQGFGQKREMLIGQFIGALESATTEAPATQVKPEATQPAPWFIRPNPAHQRKAIIIGSGLAGAFTAYHLAQRGWQVNVLERHAEPAQEGSGNRQGALYIKLPAKPTIQSQLHLVGFHYTRNLLAPVLSQHPELGDLCGLLSLATNAKEQLRQQEMLDSQQYPSTLLQGVDIAQASEIAGTAVAYPGLFYPQAGWIAPSALCRYLLQHPSITTHYNTAVDKLDYEAESKQWQINNGQFTTQTLILCTAAEKELVQSYAQLPLKPIRGQTSLAPVQTQQLKTVVCGDGYISPALNNTYCYGATFDLKSRDTQLRPEDHQQNLKMLGQALPVLADEVKEAPMAGRVAFRATTNDYIPIAGAIPDEAWVIDYFGKLRDDANWRFKPEMKHLEGLYINCGHGAKGLITIPICSALITALLEDAPLPVQQSLYHALNPARFAIKKLIKRSI